MKLFSRKNRTAPPPLPGWKRFLVGLATLTIIMISAGLAIGVDWRLGAGLFVIMLIASPFINAKWNF